ncbi:MAG: hypothetical protein ABSE99_06790 [Terracidiphilus sp.]
MGAVEGVYGRTQYLGDWISYLNVSRSVSSNDWRGIFDPMWNSGYPALIALARSLAPRTAEGEWYAIALLNFFIFLGTYASVRYLIRQAAASRDSFAEREVCRPVVTWTVCSAFLSYALCFDKVSRVAPDLLVSMLFILGAAQVLRVIRLRSAMSAATLGMILGLGCWVKGVFLCNAAIFLLILILARFTGKIPWRTFAISALVYLALFIPYVSGISWSYGQFTLGSSGELNYAFHVNHLPHWTNWQGGPSQFGRPIHSSVQLLNDLPAFAFLEPFTSTYPPYNNLAYWYRGFRHFFSIANQISAAGQGCYYFAGIVKAHQILWAFLMVLLVITLKRDWRKAALGSLRALWPIVILPVLALIPYLLVHVEDRYLGGILLVLTLSPLALALDPKFPSRRFALVFLLTAYTIGAIAELGRYDAWTIHAALHRQDFHRDPQWRLATALTAGGLRAGDTVALIGRRDANFRCSWAYVARIRVVAEFGSLPWSIEPWDRMPFEHLKPEEADQDWGTFFWQLPPEQRERVIRAFHDTGVRAVVSLAQPNASSSGWISVSDTGAWIYSFDPQLTASLHAMQQTAGHDRAVNYVGIIGNGFVTAHGTQAPHS